MSTSASNSLAQAHLLTVEALMLRIARLEGELRVAADLTHRRDAHLGSSPNDCMHPRCERVLEVLRG